MKRLSLLSARPWTPDALLYDMFATMDFRVPEDVTVMAWAGQPLE
jgi:hypothetical protein